MIDQVILIGFMGAGKTTVGNILAKMANLPYIDIDEVIISEQGMSVSDIFAKHGEKEFRRLEHEKLKDLMGTKAVIATGGGIVLNPENRKVLNDTYPVIYLETDPKVFMNRLKGDTTRPLVQQKTPEEIQAIFEPRIAHYEASADFIVNTDNRNQQEVAKAIIDMLDNEQKQR
ncbi:shikimate kinase [Listeria welshimeri]|uniref:shikimate kinase n=1 Tax=Listeria welshimeri TaxID=1643 RepID=UPI001624F377|nr:shikimate kinase [Listeria welshimeri]MBC2216024.1 shikimate kinase [Listeria welshimeri]MBF2466078.1 shikimate kinase [Listeria welshimeri]MBF2562167.1 shikimate kinase [Listeria welshimeri]MBF2614883.1 shikimate kinase [Listeria welshimeri]